VSALRLADVLLRLPALLKIEGTAKETIDVARTRVMIGGCLFALAFTVIAAKLLYLGLASEPQEPRSTRAPQPLQTERADIVDRNGTLLATSLTTQSLYANPRQMLDPADAARRLARALPSLNERELLQRLQSERAFVWIKRNLTPRQQMEVNRLGIPGLFFQREERRIYPHGALTGHLVGFTDIDNRGIAGVEQSLDERLRRQPDQRLELSIDIRAQHILRTELARQIAEFRAIGGSAIIMDVPSGELLAMVSLPDFDANSPATASDDQRFNRNTLGLYEMGSTFKTFTIAMALDGGTTHMNASYDARRPIEWGQHTINDFRGQNRWLTVPEVFMHSSNIGMVRITLQAGRERQRAFLGRLGLFRPTTVELPEVATPRIPNPWREINAMTIAFGHGMSVTPLHLLNATAASVNGGILRPVTVLRRAEPGAATGERVMAQRTSDQIRRLMRMVVTDGSGRAAAAPGYLVGGKTGTAEKIRSRRYSEHARIASFVGAFPINNPRFAILVMLDEPQPTAQTQGFATGGWVAAPLVGRLVPQLAALWNLPPLNENEPLVREQLALGTPVRRR
jgi:cell division protein FtsI (penicillin-binding protein 3)